ncbi:MAG: hypothetical protein ABI451_00530 [Dokdonella sp.]
MSTRLIVLLFIILLGACSRAPEPASTAGSGPVAGSSATSTATLVAKPASIRKCDAHDGNATVTLEWDAPGMNFMSVRVGAPDGTIFSRSQGKGTAETGPWVREDTRFFLINEADQSVLARLTIPFVDC